MGKSCFIHRANRRTHCAQAETIARRDQVIEGSFRVRDTWLRQIVMLATVLLVLHAVGAWAYDLLGLGAAITAAALVVAVSIFSGRMAGRGNDVWFVLPTVAFTAVPMAARLWTLFAVEQTWWMRAVDLGPFLIGFAAPVLLLLTVYLALGARRVPDRVESPGKPAVQVSDTSQSAG